MRKIKKFIFLSGILILFTGLSYSQVIFTQANWELSDLTPQQYQRMSKILAQTGMDSIIKVNIGDISSVPDNHINVDILETLCDSVVFKGKNVKFKSSDDYSWYGELEFDPEDSCNCRYGNLLLISKNGEKFGNIKLEGDFYTIEDLGGKNVIVQQPTNEGDIQSCGGAVQAENSGEESSSIELRNGTGNCDVTILVLYTPAADARNSNIENYGFTCVDVTNQALRNSDISSSDLDFEIAATEMYNYDETNKTFEQVLYEFSSSSIVQSRRDFYQADIVILFADDFIMDNDGTAGIAYLGPNEYSPYGVVRAIGANNGYVFSHEVGHILGARHEPCNAEDAGSHCDDSGVFEHAHTWHWDEERFCKSDITHKQRTIMYSVGGDNSDVIQHFSNPDVKVDGRSTGIENERDNALQLENNACTVANFRTGDVSLSAEIIGQSYMCEYDFACLQALVTGTPGPYTYEWKYNGTGTNWSSTPVTGTTDYYCFSTPQIPFEVGDVVFFRLKVTASNGEIAYDYHSIEIVEEGYNGMICPRSNEQIISSDLFALNPNPANDYINLTVSLKEGSNVNISLYNSYGSLVKKLNNINCFPGQNRFELDISNFKSGTYFIQVKTDNKIQRIPFIKSK